MGIDGLKKFIKENAPSAYEEVPLSALEGLRLAIDTSIQCYQLASGAAAPEPRTHMRMFRRLANGRVGMFKKYNTTPVWVLDGEPPAMKEFELKRRRAVNNNAEPLVTAEHFVQLCDIAQMHGCQIVQARGEAEAQCAYMAARGIVDAVVTEDLDALTFGAPVVFFGVKNSARLIVKITLANVLRELDITMSSFIDLCILFGCDYGPTIPGIGPKTAFKHIKKYANIGNMLTQLHIHPPCGFHWLQQSLLFTNHPYAECALVHAMPDPVRLQEMLDADAREAAQDRIPAGVFDDDVIA